MTSLVQHLTLASVILASVLDCCQGLGVIGLHAIRRIFSGRGDSVSNWDPDELLAVSNRCNSMCKVINQVFEVLPQILLKVWATCQMRRTTVLFWATISIQVLYVAGIIAIFCWQSCVYPKMRAKQEQVKAFTAKFHVNICGLRVYTAEFSSASAQFENTYADAYRLQDMIEQGWEGLREFDVDIFGAVMPENESLENQESLARSQEQDTQQETLSKPQQQGCDVEISKAAEHDIEQALLFEVPHKQEN